MTLPKLQKIQPVEFVRQGLDLLRPSNLIEAKLLKKEVKITDNFQRRISTNNLKLFFNRNY